MKISSTMGRGLLITAALSILVLMGWKALRHEGDAVQTGAPEIARQAPKENAAETQRKREIVNQWLAEQKRKLEETTQELDRLKQQREALQTELSKQQMKGGAPPFDFSIELSPAHKARTTWTGHTDPDRVWHEQRQRARETLTRFNIPGATSSR